MFESSRVGTLGLDFLGTVNGGHVTKSTVMRIGNKIINDTVETLKSLEYLPNPFGVLDPRHATWQATITHEYIGENDQALQWMIRRARQANVPMKK